MTKLDIMDRGTDASAVLRNEVIALRLGYIGESLPSFCLNCICQSHLPLSTLSLVSRCLGMSCPAHSPPLPAFRGSAMKGSGACMSVPLCFVVESDFSADSGI
jgi:hypothetical protein